MIAIMEKASRTWDTIDEWAAREGAAVLRLARRTGRREPTAAELQATAPPAEGRRITYRRLDAVSAFDRLFAGQATARTGLYATRGDRERRAENKARRQADRALGEQLRGLPVDEARRILATARTEGSAGRMSA
ncbi:MAG TPA: hypothetical protein VGR35_00235 [Tepidisphaeraceae bacterium]|nr:hypothetical protein [Tepidisphaeraceae bacterium]